MNAILIARDLRLCVIIAAHLNARDGNLHFFYLMYIQIYTSHNCNRRNRTGYTVGKQQQQQQKQVHVHG